ncbi:amidase family protein [Heyndrickxia acidicola]|uniref:Amidase family protein n=1 Tax=Heyndrickxia acidicola TaxID=209389 RepID=A0ABU6MH86_9BACI|nr:amidase family protein [Heyndrickxia acidicola]MED1204040.1 amidase family protein [Heyndrickxia acidicola]
MSSFDYESYDGLGLAQLVKTRQVKPEELAEEAIERIEQRNPKLNAIINKMYDQAKKQAARVEQNGVFAGVPMLLKNITQEIKGEAITSGSRALQTFRANQDSHYVRDLRKTGAIFLGQTNVPELALMAITEPKHHGPTRNPWNPDYTPGGSSGGAAAAVASGMVPLAGANDGGGSIRIPAAYCGLFGLKPTRGRTSVGPLYGRHWQGASVDHVLTKSVRDSAAMLDHTATVEKGAAFLAIPFQGSYLQSITEPLPKKMKIAFSVRSPIGTEVDAECQEAVEKAALLLESMGHVLIEKEPPVDGHAITKAYFTLYFAETAQALSAIRKHIGRKVRFTDVEPSTWLLALMGKITPAEEFVKNIQVWDQASCQMELFYEGFDFYMTPATALLQAKIGELSTTKIENAFVRIVGSMGLQRLLLKSGMVYRLFVESFKRTPFTQLANLTGQPAMSVPLHVTKQGLPLGVQFMASKGREDLLLKPAAELEKTFFMDSTGEDPVYCCPKLKEIRVIEKRIFS